MTKRIFQTGWCLAGLTAAALLLHGCSGGGTNSAAPTELTGVAATGAAIANAAVETKCIGSPGSIFTGTTSATGAFTLSGAAGASAPCMLKVTSGSTNYYSYAATAGRINITPFTDLIVAKAFGSDPATAYANFDATKAATISANLASAKTFVTAQVTQLAGKAPVGDPLTGVFVIGDADDKVLDGLGAALTNAGTTHAALRTGMIAGTPLATALPEETRPQDTKAYAVNSTDAAATTFAAMASAGTDVVDMSTTSRWAGVLGGAAYRIEVPANWNGELVMYAHGYAGEGLSLNAVDTVIRRHLIQNGYAWATSSYSKNSYDVRAGIEDTNKLALNFNTIAASKGRTLATPSKMYILGSSMGGHIAAAAVEAETLATAVNKVKYDGAMPMCAVAGDVELFNTLGAQQMAAQALGGQAASPARSWSTIKDGVQSAIFSSYGAAPTPLAATVPTGAQYFSVVKNLTGGSRPMFDVGMAYGGSFQSAWGFFGVDSVLTGMTTKVGTDTNRFVYKIDDDAAASTSLNGSVQKLTGQANYNRLRRDGLRWVPQVNGEMAVPVLTMHTLGDLFVPFSMQQVYRTRTVAKGNGSKLVQRAIRGVSHCDFLNAEIKQGFDDLVKWVKQGTVPAGDDVLTAATVAANTYGCTHTKYNYDADDSSTYIYFRINVAPYSSSGTCTGSPFQPSA